MASGNHNDAINIVHIHLPPPPELIPDDEPLIVRPLNTMGRATTALFLSSSAKSNLATHQAAIQLAKAEVILLPLGSSAYINALSNLAAILYTRSFATQEEAPELGQTISWIQAELSTCTVEAHREQGSRLVRLCDALEMCYRCNKNVALLEDAARHLDQAMNLCAPGSYEYYRVMYKLGTALVDLYNNSQHLQNLELGVAYIETWVDSPCDYVKTDFLTDINRHLNNILSNTLSDAIDPQLVYALGLRLCRAAVRLLPIMAFRPKFGNSEALEAVFSEGLRIGHLGAHALLLSVPLETLGEGLELLEGTRAVFWAHSLRLRTALDNLPPHESDQLSLLFRFLDDRRRGKPSHICLVNAATGQPIRPVELDLSAKQEIETLVSNIRQRPTFSRFLLEPTYDALATTAAAGHVVTLVAHPLTCEAIVIVAPTGRAQRVMLPGLHSSDLQIYAMKIKQDHLRLRKLAQNGSTAEQPDLLETEARLAYWVLLKRLTRTVNSGL